MYRVRKSWNDVKSQVGAFLLLKNAKKKADETKLNVYDSRGNLVYPQKTTTATYRVRKTWADSKSQVGAYKSLENAKKACDEHIGYSVFDESGKALYTSKATPTPTITDKIVKACKEQTEWAYKSTYKWESKPTVAKSKKNGTCVTYVACVLQRAGIIKSGQYIWHNGSGFGKGKVTGATDKFAITYFNNKKSLKDLKNVLKKGDIVMYDDKRSGRAGDGGHIEIFNGIIDSNGKFGFFSGGLGSGHNTSNTHKEKGTRKVLCIARAKG